MPAEIHGRHLSRPARQAEAPSGVDIDAARRDLAKRFREAGIASASLDAKFLTEAVSAPRSDVSDRSRVDDEVMSRLQAMATRRIAGEPVWRILGEREFWGLPFKLSPATLEPRPDSETIVEAALAALGERCFEAISILDLGTGTGCLLIALASECPQASGLGIDIAPEAVTTARENAVLNGVSERIAFRQGDWLAGLEDRFDVVLSNPPYIPAAEIAGLDRGVRDYDPMRALDGGGDGLDAYRVLARDLAGALKPGGIAVLEIGAGQEADVAAILTAGGLAHRATRHDLGGHARALIFTSA